MRRTLVVAVREFQAAVRTKTFIISLTLMPVMGSAGLVAALLLKDQVNLDDKRFAIIDGTSAVYPELLRAADEYNTVAVFAKPDPQRQIKPRFVLEHIEVGSRDIQTVRGELSDRVRHGTLTGFVEIAPDTLTRKDATRDSDHRVTYCSNNPMYRDFLDWMTGRVNEIVREWRIREAGLAGDTVHWATQRVRVDDQPLYVSAGQGVIRAARKNDRYVNIFAGLGFAVLMFLVIFVGAIPLTYSVLEEKMQRSAEVLLGCVTPFQFMMGKVLGMVGVSLTIVTIYLVLGFGIATACGYGHTLPRHLINWFLLYQAGAILMFGSLYAAIGAACNDMKDAQNLMAPASLIACIPLFVIHPVMLEPNSTFSTLVSFFPPATPMLMILRQGLPVPIPLWQPIVGLILVLVSALACVGLAARVFSMGILMQGKGANAKELLQWAFYGVGHRPQRPERRGGRTTAGNARPGLPSTHTTV